jgi:2,5-dihydroxypyridine 5,6-dioxygenase
MDALEVDHDPNASAALRRAHGRRSPMRPVEMNPAKLAALFAKQFRLCNVKAGEAIVIITDLNSPREYVAAAFAAADELEAHIYEMCTNTLSSWVKLGQETVGEIKGTLDALRAADLLVCLHLPLFTKWLREVRNGGTRVLSVRDTPDMLEQLMAPRGLKEAIVHAGDRLRKAKEMRVLSDAGTDLRVSLGEYPTMIQYGYADERGRFDHWGAGHVHTFPNEGTANGTVVVQPGDCVVLPYCRYVHDQVRIEIRDGFIRQIEGGLDAKLMRDWLEDNRRTPDDMDGHAISHLGWGLNPQARWDNVALRGDDPENHRAALRTFPGNFLFSTGPNTEGGGKRATRGHYDVPMRDCTVLLDNDVVIDRGRVVDEKMIVQREAR